MRLTSAVPNFSSPLFVVKITASLGDGKYTWKEQWDTGAGTLAEKVGSPRYGTSNNPGVDVLGVGFAVGDAVQCRSADGRGGLTWELYPIGGSGSSGEGECKGDAWLTVADPADCYTVSVDGGAAQPIDEPILINGTEFTAIFDPAVPSLALEADGYGGPISGVKDCGACPCITFAFPRATFFPDDEPAASVCGRLLRVKVCQAECEPFVVTDCGCPDDEGAESFQFTLPPLNNGNLLLCGDCASLAGTYTVTYDPEASGGGQCVWKGVGGTVCGGAVGIALIRDGDTISVTAAFGTGLSSCFATWQTTAPDWDCFSDLTLAYLGICGTGVCSAPTGSPSITISAV